MASEKNNVVRDFVSRRREQIDRESPQGVVMGKRDSTICITPQRYFSRTQAAESPTFAKRRKQRKKMTKPREIDAVAFGQRVKELRDKLGITQGALGKAIGVTGAVVGAWERGQVKNAGNIVDLARALCTSPEWLQYAEGQKEVRPFRPLDQILRLYEELGEARAGIVIEFMRSILHSPPRQKKPRKSKKQAA